MSEFEEAHFEEARVFMSSDLGIPLEVIDEIDSRITLCTDLLDVYELGLFTPLELYECVNDEAWIDDNIQYLESLVVYSGYVQDKLLRGEAVTEEALRGFSHKDYGRFKQRSAANRFRLAMKKARLEYLQAKDELLRIEAKIATVNRSIASKSGSQASIGTDAPEHGPDDDGDDGSVKPQVIQVESNAEAVDTMRDETRRILRADDERKHGPGGRSSYVNDRPHAYGHLYQPEGIRKRHTISRKITFSGRASETWKPFQKLLTAHMAGENCAYLLQPKFLSCYELHGRRAIDIFVDPSTGQLIPISTAQFDADVKYLYSTLQSAFRSEDIAYITDAYEDSEDGVLTWLDALKEFGEHENKEVNRTLFTSKLHTMNFTRNYKGGLAQFVADHRSIFSKLATNGRSYSDADKIEAIYANLQHTEFGQGLVRTCRVDPAIRSFPEVCAAPSSARQHMKPATMPKPTPEPMPASPKLATPWPIWAFPTMKWP